MIVSHKSVSVTSDIKEKILVHARERFFREGFAKISVDEITSELSMSKKTFYQGFASKDDLVEELMQRHLAGVNASMDHILAQTTDFVHKFHEFISYVAGMLGMIAKTFLSDLERHMPHLWKRIEEFRRERLSKSLTLLLEQGMREGYIRKEVNIRVFQLALIASVERIIQPHLLSNESFSAKEALQAIMDVFFQGIFTEAARRGYSKLLHKKVSQARRGLS